MLYEPTPQHQDEKSASELLTSSITTSIIINS